MMKYCIQSLLILSTLLFSPLFSDVNKFVVVTPPKTGTYLLNKVLTEMTLKRAVELTDGVAEAADRFKFIKDLEQRNCYVFFHDELLTPQLLKRLTKEGYLVLSILRDPRDQLISLWYYNNAGYWPHLPLNQLSQDDQIEELITGERFGFKAYERCYSKNLQMIWNHFNCLTTRFEKLVGPRGGGSLENQLQEITTISEFLNIELTQRRKLHIAKKAFGDTATFRSGQIGEWKKHFNLHHAQLYDQLYGEELKFLGYDPTVQDFSQQ